MKFNPVQTLWTILGVSFIILGVIGIFTPLMPGPALIILGAIFLGIERKVIDNFISKYLKKFKKKLK